MNVSVTGIPKTIDNDLDIIDRSFGFLTAVEVIDWSGMVMVMVMVVMVMVVVMVVVMVMVQVTFVQSCS